MVIVTDHQVFGVVYFRAIANRLSSFPTWRVILLICPHKILFNQKVFMLFYLYKIVLNQNILMI